MKDNQMRKTTTLLGLILTTLLLGALGCSTLRIQDTARLQGAWQGREIGGQRPGPCYILISGTNADYRGVDTNEWIKGTFSLREDKNPKQFICVVNACFDESCIGRTINCIYQLDAGTLKLTGSEPGNPDFPSDFDASGARQFEFIKK
jgi:uncharacterized protein (TIGR03067 family)